MKTKYLLKYKVLLNNKIVKNEIICASPKEAKQKAINICVCVKSLDPKNEVKNIEVIKLTHEHSFDLKELDSLITKLETNPKKKLLTKNPFAYLKNLIPQNNS